ncbi:CvpA family protein [Limisphaera ngatamarikiensis]|uniref:CvpA family protein n=1 Tax=Limisphaera ngatamarikiensis TaxID=1324935 RepID=A0A6M1RY43_9BACT|nr:CvpA family protein [Limisphaera ngatamarikiensis]NGO38090.1 CvpA family protein [Limisphaera ngatamarikiensis]
MTIWILVLVLLASVTALGYRQGGVRVAFSLVGILLGVWLAIPMSPWMGKVLGWIGVKHPFWAWILPPVLVFWLINGLFKAVAFQVHRKVDVFFKYHAGDLHRALFERLNARLGACLGFVNGTIYTLLVCLGIYMFGYWTTQLGSEEGDPWTMRLFNRLAHDLEETRLHRAVAALDPLPEVYYQAADFVGLLFHNPMLEGRLARYPALLEIAERPELHGFAQDTSWTQLRQSRAPLREVLAHPQMTALMQNLDLLREIWAILEPDLPDLMAYLETGRSPKYEKEPILGTWAFDFRTAFVLYRKANPRMTALQLREARKHLSGIFLNTSLVAAPSGFVALKNYPVTRAPRPGETAPATEHRTITGRWRSENGRYTIEVQLEGQQTAWPVEIANDRLQIPSANPPLAFERDSV